jgi:WD40 repeat protein
MVGRGQRLGVAATLLSLAIAPCAASPAPGPVKPAAVPGKPASGPVSPAPVQPAPRPAMMKLTAQHRAALADAHAQWVAFHRDGKRWAAALPGVVYVWDGEAAPRELEVPTQGLAFSDDGKRLLASPYRLDPDRPAPAPLPDPLRATLNAHGRQYDLVASAFSPDGAELVLVASFRPGRGLGASGERPPQPEQILLVDGATGKLARALWRGDDTRCEAVAVGARFIAAADVDVWLWPRHGARPARRVLAGPQAQVRALQFSPDGARLAAVDADGMATLWDAASGTRLVRWKVHDDNAPRLAFHPRLPVLATGSADGAIRLWSFAATGDPVLVAEAKDQGGMVESLAFSPDGKRLLAAVNGRPVFYDVAAD